MNFKNVKISYNIPKKIILVRESSEKFVPEYLYLTLEFNIKNKEKLSQDDFLEFKVILLDKETTISKIQKGEW